MSLSRLGSKESVPAIWHALSSSLLGCLWRKPAAMLQAVLGRSPCGRALILSIHSQWGHDSVGFQSYMCWGFISPIRSQKLGCLIWGLNPLLLREKLVFWVPLASWIAAGWERHQRWDVTNLSYLLWYGSSLICSMLRRLSDSFKTSQRK